MTGYIVNRLLMMVPVLLLVSIVVFGLVLLLPGDAAVALLAERSTPELLEQVRAELGLDRPVLERYLTWLGQALRGDFGHSIRTQQPVGLAILERVPPTLQITTFALLISLLIGIPLGVLSASRRGRVMDLVSTLLILAGASMPSFWLGILLILLFSLQLRVAPASGWVPLTENPWVSLQHAFLPSVTLGLWMAAVVARQCRGSMMDVLVRDYIRTGRAKGLHEQSILARHALKNALLPVVSVLGQQVGRLIGGAVVVESVFAVPGMGRLMLDSIFTRDFPVVQICTLFIAVAVLFASLITDVVYAYLDPRIRYR